MASASPSPRVARAHLQSDAAPATASNARELIEEKLKEERFSKVSRLPSRVALSRILNYRATQHSIPIKPPAPGTASAFYVPSTPIIPPKPPANPPAPTPKRQSEVTGDFSNAKPGQQIAHSTFQNWVDAYLRPFGEDDLAVLAAKVGLSSARGALEARLIRLARPVQPEDLTPYIIPPLGKHYLERWEEEDLDPSQRHPNTSFHSPLEPPVLPRLKPEALTEDALAGENVFLGPLSERLMAALAVGEDGLVAVDDEDDDMVSAEDTAAPPRLPMDAVDFEERVKRELRYIGVLPEEEVRLPASHAARL